MSAREEVLGRIRAALADVPPDDEVPIPRNHQRTAPPDVDVAHLFAERVADYRATVHRVPAGEVAATVAAALAQHGVRRVVVPADLPPEWLAASEAEVVRDDGSLSASALDALDGVVTAAAVGIAETGTIVLDGGERSGRRALTLVPDHHLCVVEAATVVAGVPDAVAELAAAAAEGRPITLVSGPSATSDIELDRVEGVHGPRVLDVFVVS